MSEQLLLGWSHFSTSRNLTICTMIPALPGSEKPGSKSCSC